MKCQVGTGDSFKETDCSSLMDTCVKQVTEGIVTKSCSLLAGYKQNECKETSLLGIDTEYCTCDSDNCNGAFGIVPLKALSLVVVAVFAALFGRY